MALTVTASNVATYNGLSSGGAEQTNLATRVLNIGEAEAVIEAKRVLGSTRYDAVADAGSGTAYDNLLRAVSVLCYYYAMPNVNLLPGDDGGFQRATGLVENQNDVMSQKELQAYRQRIYERAQTLLSEIHEDTGRQPYQTTGTGRTTTYAL